MSFFPLTLRNLFICLEYAVYKSFHSTVHTVPIILAPGEYDAQKHMWLSNNKTE